jgi:hypothetical protein
MSTTVITAAADGVAIFEVVIEIPDMCLKSLNRPKQMACFDPGVSDFTIPSSFRTLPVGSSEMEEKQTEAAFTFFCQLDDDDDPELSPFCQL